MSDQLPGIEELASIPRWALVVYAVRCARRARPLIEKFWRDVDPEMERAVDAAIQDAEIAAATSANDRLGDAYAEAARAGRAARGLAERVRTARPRNPRAGMALESASRAAIAAAYAARAAARDDLVSVRMDVHAAASASLDAAADGARVPFLQQTARFWEEPSAGAAMAARAAMVKMVRAARSDLESLRRIAERDGWTDDSLVRTDALGPLWPLGGPEDLLPAPFSVVIDPGEADAAIIAEVLAALSELYEATTGYALSFEEDGYLVRADEEARL